MGKPSIKSRKTSRIRKKKRNTRLIKTIKQKEEEVADLQIQLQDFKKQVVDSGESVLYEINKCSRENNNLVGWLKLYENQIKNYEKEIYDLNLRLYFSQPQHRQPQIQPQTQPQTQPQSLHQPLSHQPQPQPQPQSPTFKSLADYFNYFKNQE